MAKQPSTSLETSDIDSPAVAALADAETSQTGTQDKDDLSIVNRLFQKDDSTKGLPKIPSLLNKARGAANTLWLANLGAASLLEKNSVRLFNNLVQEGKDIQEITKGARAKVSGKVHFLENRFDTKVNNTLHWFGVPSRNDFDQLAEKVQKLSDSLTDLTQQLRESLEVEQR